MGPRTQRDQDQAWANHEGEHLRICVICGRRLVREILSRALIGELEAETDAFACCEDALASDLDYDVFIVYDYFGEARMNGPQGAKRLRFMKPKAYVLGVTHNPGFDKQFVQVGADTAIVVGERSVKRIVRVVRQRIVTTLYPEAARDLNQEE
jgi:hypothetical protein